MTERVELMKCPSIGPLILHAAIEKWPLAAPFRLAGHTFDVLEILLIRLENDGHIGHGEADGVFYFNDHPASMMKQIEPLRATIEKRISRESLQALLPPGGARNALDCALWDLEAKLTGRPAWKIAELQQPRPLLTTFTCGADAPERMAERVRTTYASARAIKVKLTGEPIDEDRIRAVREARADVWLGVDANQSLTPASLERLMPVLTQARVDLLEQPFPIGKDALLDGYRSPVPIAADESLQSLAHLPALIGRYSVANIKLDKCGGLTEALALVRGARELGLETMVGNMMGTSLAMGPAFLVGQLCNVVDLDAPVFLKADRPVTVQYHDGFITCPKALWGSAVEGAMP